MRRTCYIFTDHILAGVCFQLTRIILSMTDDLVLYLVPYVAKSCWPNENLMVLMLD